MSSSPTIRLLVIDDDPLQCELLTHVLGNAGFLVITLNSGEAATSLFAGKHSRFDALLIDLQLPGAAGHEVAMQLRDQAGNGVLIGMSARAARTDELQAFDVFLPKPFDPAALRSAIAEARENRRSGASGSPAPAQPPSQSTFPGTRSERGTPSGHALPNDAQHSRQLDEASSPVVLNQRIFAQLQATVGADPLRQLYEMTATDVEARLARMSSSLQAGDEQEVRREAHAIKGSCAMVGATELSQLAAGIETGSETDSLQLSAMREACIRLRRVVTIVQP